MTEITRLKEALTSFTSSSEVKANHRWLQNFVQQTKSIPICYDAISYEDEIVSLFAIQTLTRSFTRSSKYWLASNQPTVNQAAEKLFDISQFGFKTQNNPLAAGAAKGLSHALCFLESTTLLERFRDIFRSQHLSVEDKVSIIVLSEMANSIPDQEASSSVRTPDLFSKIGILVSEESAYYLQTASSYVEKTDLILNCLKSWFLAVDKHNPSQLPNYRTSMIQISLRMQDCWRTGRNDSLSLFESIFLESLDQHMGGHKFSTETASAIEKTLPAVKLFIGVTFESFMNIPCEETSECQIFLIRLFTGILGAFGQFFILALGAPELLAKETTYQPTNSQGNYALQNCDIGMLQSACTSIFLTVCSFTKLPVEESSLAFMSLKEFLQVYERLKNRFEHLTEGISNLCKSVDGKHLLWTNLLQSCYPDSYENLEAEARENFNSYRQDCRHFFRLIIGYEEYFHYGKSEFLIDCEMFLDETYMIKLEHVRETRLEAFLHCFGAISRDLKTVHSRNICRIIHIILAHIQEISSRRFLRSLCMTLGNYSHYLDEQLISQCWRVFQATINLTQDHRYYPLSSKQDHIASLATLRVSLSCTQSFPLHEWLARYWQCYEHDVLNNAPAKSMELSSLLLIICTVGQVVNDANPKNQSTLDELKQCITHLIKRHIEVLIESSSNPHIINFTFEALEAFLATSTYRSAQSLNSNVCKKLGLYRLYSLLKLRSTSNIDNIELLILDLFHLHLGHFFLYQDNKAMSSCLATLLSLPCIGTTKGLEIFRSILTHIFSNCWTSFSPFSDILTVALQKGQKEPEASVMTPIMEHFIVNTKESLANLAPVNFSQCEKALFIGTLYNKCRFNMSESHEQTFWLFCCKSLLIFFLHEDSATARNALTYLNSFANKQSTEMRLYLSTSLIGLNIESNEKYETIPCVLYEDSPIGAAVLLCLLRALCIVSDPTEVIQALFTFLCHIQPYPTIRTFLLSRYPATLSVTTIVQFDVETKSLMKFKRYAKTLRDSARKNASMML